MDFTLNVWPIALVSLAMIVAAIIDGWKLKVPNALTFPLIISGWILGLLNTFQILPDSGSGGIGGSLTATVLGFALIFPVYAIGGMGAGDVKMQMGFGAWVGAYYSFGQAQYIVLIAFCWGAIIGGIIAFFMILFRRQISNNILNTREILSDLATKSVDETEQKAAARKPRMHLLPYGIPLCLGFLGYLAYLHLYLHIPLPVYPIQ
jgi:prepilin peptidase CpaA